MARDGFTALRYRVEAEELKKRQNKIVREMVRLHRAGNTEAVNVGLLALNITPAMWEQVMNAGTKKQLGPKG